MIALDLDKLGSGIYIPSNAARQFLYQGFGPPFPPKNLLQTESASYVFVVDIEFMSSGVFRLFRGNTNVTGFGGSAAIFVVPSTGRVEVQYIDDNATLAARIRFETGFPSPLIGEPISIAITIDNSTGTSFLYAAPFGKDLITYNTTLSSFNYTGKVFTKTDNPNVIADNSTGHNDAYIYFAGYYEGILSKNEVQDIVDNKRTPTILESRRYYEFRGNENNGDSNIVNYNSLGLNNWEMLDNTTPNSTFYNYGGGGWVEGDRNPAI